MLFGRQSAVAAGNKWPLSIKSWLQCHERCNGRFKRSHGGNNTHDCQDFGTRQPHRRPSTWNSRHPHFAWASAMPCALQTGRHGEFEMRLASTTAAPRVRARGPQIAHATRIWSGDNFRPLQRLCGTARGNQRDRPPAIGCHGEFVRTLGARQQPRACVYGTCC